MIHIRKGKRVTVSIKGISKKFVKGAGSVQILENINFQLEKGDFITIIGPSGCGKSTLLKIVGEMIADAYTLKK